MEPLPELACLLHIFARDFKVLIQWNERQHDMVSNTQNYSFFDESPKRKCEQPYLDILSSCCNTLAPNICSEDIAQLDTYKSRIEEYFIAAQLFGKNLTQAVYAIWLSTDIAHSYDNIVANSPSLLSDEVSKLYQQSLKIIEDVVYAQTACVLSDTRQKIARALDEYVIHKK